MLFKRRTVLLPTLWGWLLIAAIMIVPVGIWTISGEKFMAVNAPTSSGVLVVEGWIGVEAMRDAKQRFSSGSYDYVVATGNLSGEPWQDRRWSYAKDAERILLQLKVPADKILLAVPIDSEVHRTFECAAAVRRALEAKGIRPSNIDVFTIGAHGRRSRLTYSKVFSGYSEVGVISWQPPTYSQSPWWTSSERALDLIKETGAYFFELFLNSGRSSNKA